LLIVTIKIDFDNFLFHEKLQEMAFDSLLDKQIVRTSNYLDLVLCKKMSTQIFSSLSLDYLYKLQSINIQLVIKLNAQRYSRPERGLIKLQSTNTRKHCEN